MRRPRRLAALLLVTAVPLAGLVACGSTSNSGTNNGGTSDSGTKAAQSQLRGVTVTGPTVDGTRHNAFSAPVFDVGTYGYTEQEYFYSGQATAYEPVPGTQLGADGRWKLQPSRTAPFKTRMLVVRPSDPKKFSGRVWLSWLNVTAGFEIGDITQSTLRDGDAVVYVSAQKIGLYGVPGAEQNGLREWDPTRYGSLFHPGDDFSYDIYTKAALLVGRNRGHLPVDPMAGFHVTSVFGTGASQSAIRLTTYLDGVQPLSKALDGALLAGSFGSGARVQTPSGAKTDVGSSIQRQVRIRDDLGIPAMLVTTETEAPSLYPVRQPDTKTFRTWEIAGASHAGAASSIDDVVKTFVRDSLKLPAGALGSTSGATGAVSQPDALNWLPVLSTARHDLDRWATDGTAPPTFPLITFGGTPPTIQRDSHGNALGGIRMPELQAPVATYNGGSQSSLFGSMKPFTAAQLRALYPDRQTYLAAYDKALDQGVKAGYFLTQDAAGIKTTEAKNAAVLFPR